MNGTEPPGRERRILLVDDAATVRMFCRRILEADGFAVEEAVNGLDALETALAQPGDSAAPARPWIDLLVVDINMTRMDGCTMLRRFREDPGLCGVPALVLSAVAKEADRRRAFEAGANHYMTKPVRPGPFLDLVRLMTGVARP